MIDCTKYRFENGEFVGGGKRMKIYIITKGDEENETQTGNQ